MFSQTVSGTDAGESDECDIAKVSKRVAMAANRALQQLEEEELVNWIICTERLLFKSLIADASVR